MPALLLPIILGLSISHLTGGELGRLRHTPFRGSLLAAAALLVQVLLFNPALERYEWVIQNGPYLYLLSMVVVLLVLAANVASQVTRFQRIALASAAVGVALNCLVVSANGAYMPRIAADAHPTVPSPAEAGRLVNVAPMNDETQLPFLGDVLPEPAWWPLSNVLSIGDVLLATGLAAWAVTLTRTSKPRNSRTSSILASTE